MQDFEKQRKELAQAVDKRDEYSIKGKRAIQQAKKDIDDKRAKIQKIKLKLKKLDKKQQAIETKNIEKLQEEIKQISGLPIFDTNSANNIDFGKDSEFFVLYGQTFDFNYTE